MEYQDDEASFPNCQLTGRLITRAIGEFDDTVALMLANEEHRVILVLTGHHAIHASDVCNQESERQTITVTFGRFSWKCPKGGLMDAHLTLEADSMLKFSTKQEILIRNAQADWISMLYTICRLRVPSCNLDEEICVERSMWQEYQQQENRKIWGKIREFKNPILIL